jgi:hypothetical protein
MGIGAQPPGRKGAGSAGVGALTNAIQRGDWAHFDRSRELLQKRMACSSKAVNFGVRFSGNNSTVFAVIAESCFMISATCWGGPNM